MTEHQTRSRSRSKSHHGHNTGKQSYSDGGNLNPEDRQEYQHPLSESKFQVHPQRRSSKPRPLLPDPPNNKRDIQKNKEKPDAAQTQIAKCDSRSRSKSNHRHRARMHSNSDGGNFNPAECAHPLRESRFQVHPQDKSTHQRRSSQQRPLLPDPTHIVKEIHQNLKTRGKNSKVRLSCENLNSQGTCNEKDSIQLQLSKRQKNFDCRGPRNNTDKWVKKDLSHHNNYEYLGKVLFERKITESEYKVVGTYVQNQVFGQQFKTRVVSVNRTDTMCHVTVAFESSDKMAEALVNAQKKNIPGICIGGMAPCDKTYYHKGADHVQIMEQKAKKVLHEHEEKISNVKLHIADLSDCTLSRTQLGELEALQSKNNELLDQKATFERHFQLLKEKVEEIEVSGKERSEERVHELRKEFGLECHKLLKALPIYSKKDELIDLVKSNQVCIVLAETGSGKSTQMVQYLQQAGFGQGKLIACTQPRKVAAISLAKFVATEMDTLVGELVGYQVGMQRRKGEHTQVLFMTDHTFLNETLKDPLLMAYSCIVIDEAHERSLHTDLLLGMLKKCLSERQDLKIIITSATINPDLFVKYFGGCPILKVSGRLFPVDVIWKPIYEKASEDYIAEAVNKVMEIHRSNIDGDILVFLTSGAETERACAMMNAMPRCDNIIFLQLHGKLQVEEQQLVFNPPEAGKRKVVFATNCAETSITIPGIKVVIDTGMVKEMTYDPKRNMRSLQLSMINKSSAEQRKGRAGRVEAGTCYRLYTEKEFEEMADYSPPEILRVHLGHALLTLMNLGIENPLDFDFVESPSPDALTNAMVSLEDIQAVTSGKLSEMGKKMAALPVDPRLGRVILKGLEEGCGLEAVVVAAVCTIAGSIFFRAGSEDNKLNADKLKVRFCHHRGDIITLLEVFKEWNNVPEKNKNRWCVENSINAKAMRMARETVKDLLKVLSKDLDTQLEFAFKNDEVPDLLLSRLIFDSYFTNLCVYTGHQRVGYVVARLDKNVQLHPSGALNYTGNPPQWIVFEQLTTTSRDFVMCITTVEEEWISKLLTDGRLKFDIPLLKNRILKQSILPNVGSTVIQNIIGPRYTRLHQLEAVITSQSDQSMVLLEPNRSRGEICIFTSERYIKKAEEILSLAIQIERDKLSKEMEESFLSKDASVRVIWGAGADVRCVLMPDEFRTVLVKSVPSEMEDSHVLEVMETFGNISEYRIFGIDSKRPTQKNWGKITYENAESAKKAVEETKDRTPTALPERKPRANAALFNFTVMAEWCRRPTRGFGFVEFESIEDKTIVMAELGGYLRVGEPAMTVRASKDKPLELFLSRIHSSVQESDIKDSIMKKFPSVNVKSARIPRVKVDETTQTVLDIHKDRLTAAVKNHVPQERFNIKIFSPRPADFYFRAVIQFQMAADGMLVVESLRDFSISDQVVKFKAEMRSSVYIPAAIERFVSSDLEEVISHLKDRHKEKLNINKKILKSKTTVVDLIGSGSEVVNEANELIRQVIKADAIDCNQSEPLRNLLSKQGREFTRGIADRTGALVQLDERTNSLFIYGTDANKNKAKVEINSFLDSQQSLCIKEIPLRGSNRPPGLLKAVFAKYGFDLNALHDECGLVNVSLNIKRHAVSASGTEDSIVKLVETIDGLAADLSPSSKKDDDIDCVVCFMPVESTVVRLESCGHPYCSECVRNQVDVSITSKDFPITCAADGCNKPFSVRDFHQILGSTNKLVDAAVSSFVMRNSKQYQYCITPNCPIIYRVTDKGSLFQCEKCQVNLCTACKVQYHHGQSCEMYRGIKEDPDFQLKVWMKRKGEKKCKLCPRCSMAIEKNSGCMRMVCLSCKTIFCWHCRATFPSSQACYDHLASSHDGIFGVDIEHGED